MRDYHRENLEGEQRWREGKRERGSSYCYWREQG